MDNERAALDRSCCVVVGLLGRGKKRAKEQKNGLSGVQWIVSIAKANLSLARTEKGRVARDPTLPPTEPRCYNNSNDKGEPAKPSRFSWADDPKTNVEYLSVCDVVARVLCSASRAVSGRTVGRLCWASRVVVGRLQAPRPSDLDPPFGTNETYGPGRREWMLHL
jgi:hypothetical protein